MFLNYNPFSSNYDDHIAWGKTLRIILIFVIFTIFQKKSIETAYNYLLNYFSISECLLFKPQLYNLLLTIYAQLVFIIILFSKVFYLFQFFQLGNIFPDIDINLSRREAHLLDFLKNIAYMLFFSSLININFILFCLSFLKTYSHYKFLIIFHLRLFVILAFKLIFLPIDYISFLAVMKMLTLINKVSKNINKYYKIRFFSFLKHRQGPLHSLIFWGFFIGVFYLLKCITLEKNFQFNFFIFVVINKFLLFCLGGAFHVATDYFLSASQKCWNNLKMIRSARYLFFILKLLILILLYFSILGCLTFFTVFTVIEYSLFFLKSNFLLKSFF